MQSNEQRDRASQTGALHQSAFLCFWHRDKIKAKRPPRIFTALTFRLHVGSTSLFLLPNTMQWQSEKRKNENVKVSPCNQSHTRLLCLGVWLTKLAEDRCKWKTTVGNSVLQQTCSRILHSYQSEKRLTVKLAKTSQGLPRNCETDGQFMRGGGKMES